MLPFLKPRRQTGLIISTRQPDGSNDLQHEEGDENQALEAAAEHIIRAINSKDAKDLAIAIRSAFQIVDAEPHEEGEHINEEQN